jgi:hypothetical protein
MALKITKAQYAHLIREISDALKDDIKGGGLYDFAAPEVYSEHPMSQVKFWVADGSMQGGGFFSSIGMAAKGRRPLLRAAVAVCTQPHMR